MTSAYLLLFVCMIAATVAEDREVTFGFEENFLSQELLAELKNHVLLRESRGLLQKRADNHCDDVDRNKLCCAEIKNIKPYSLTITNKISTTRGTVIQTDTFEQYVPQVKCRNESAPCFSDFEWPNTYKFKCKTDRGQIKLLILTSEGNLEFTEVPIDISCSCHISNVNA